jgi:glucokinase
MGDEHKRPFWLGLDIGGTKILGACVGDDLSLKETLKTETFRDQGPKAVVERALGLCRELMERHGSVEGLGVGFAGLVDWRTGKILSSIMLPGWSGFPLAEVLSDALGDLPVFVDNDATAAGFGEYLALGSPEGMNLVLLTIGTGIGGAIILDGRLYRGATGTSAEFGNTTIDWQGKVCWCGNRGCLNMLASGSAISERAATLADGCEDSALKGLERPISVEKISRLAREGDGPAAQAIEEGARALGSGVANIINIFNPDRVVLTGGVSVLGRPYLDIVREEAGIRAFDESAAHARIEMSVVGPEVGALGAAGLVRARELKKDR